MKSKKLLSTALSFLMLATTVCAAGCGGGGEQSSSDSTPATAETYDLEYAMTLPTSFSDAAVSSLGYEVSPFIYGEFLEHIPGCIYGVIWSELLMDRKFYYPAGEEGLSPWTVTGEVTSTEACYSLNGYAVVLKDGMSIAQNVTFIQKDYTGYFYAAGEGEIQINVGGYTQNYQTSGDFKKYEFSLTSSEASEREVSFKCVSGEVKLDSLSLMPADNYYGMRKDTLDAMKELSGTIYRWPGGNFVSGYDWKDGIGDRDKRVCLRNQAWFPDKGNIESDISRLADGDFYGRVEPNDMGTDEFLAMCDYIGATPLLAVNTGTGTAESAADYVNYCNGSTDTEYGALRAANGHSEPYNVTNWCVGNEMQGDWQIGHMPLVEYVNVHNEVAEAMKAADPSIILTGCGDNASHWTEGMFQSCASNMDYIAEHLYAVRDLDTDFLNALVLTESAFTDRILKHRTLIEEYPDAKNIMMAFDEYALNWNGTPNMRDAMFIAAILNIFIKNADVVGMGNYSDAVFVNTRSNVPGALYAYTDHVEFTPIGHVLQAYAQNMQNNSLTMTIRETKRTNLRYQATVSADKKTLSLAVVNPSDQTIKLSWSGVTAQNVKHVGIVAEEEFSLADGVTKTETQSPESMIMQPLSVNVFVFNLG